MAKHAVIRTGGKQYLVRENQTIVVDKLDQDINSRIELETLCVFDEDADSVDLGTPALKKGVQAEVVEHGRGEKIAVRKFKAKVRYRRNTGFRAEVTKLKILSI
ncbi:MAG: 50S ribosomal protein L21 [Patescibacteria group bacterium]|nr:50S ribosomal protein L21 [Patescibacteria group bacterium]